MENAIKLYLPFVRSPCGETPLSSAQSEAVYLTSENYLELRDNESVWSIQDAFQSHTKGFPENPSRLEASSRKRKSHVEETESTKKNRSDTMQYVSRIPSAPLFSPINWEW